MEDLRRYVLYSREQEEAFRNRYANVIAARRRAYVKWLRSLPLLEWVDYLVQVSPRDYEAIIGLICINLYLNTSLCDILDGLTPGTVQALAARENFAADAKELIVSALEPVRARVMADDSILPSNKNKAIVEELDQKGMFRLKDSVVFVAEQLGISRNTIYMHLRNHRKRTENN